MRPELSWVKAARTRAKEEIHRRFIVKKTCEIRQRIVANRVCVLLNLDRPLTKFVMICLY